MYNMKNELLARAISELDDDLIKEAHLPIPKKKHIITAIKPSYLAAAAACLIVVFTALSIPFWNDENISLTVKDISMTEETCVEIPLISTMRQRNVAGTEIPLRISGIKNSVSLSGSEGSVILNADGTECKELVLSNDAEIVWVVNPLVSGSFELKLDYGKKTVILTAAVSQSQDKIVVTANY